MPGLDANNLLVPDNKVEAAPGTAIRTRGWYVLEFHVLTSNVERSVMRLYKVTEKMPKNDEYRWVKELPNTINKERVT